jgi:cobalt-zinc-cadmium efflux system protein
MHAHGHSHAPPASSRTFAIGIGLNVLFVLVEVVFGLRAHSLALLSDAGHNLGDVLGLGLSWGAIILGQRPPTERHTYGMRRASILASLSNALLLLVAVGGISWEALQRLLHPHPVEGGTVMVVAAIGILVNGLAALMFMSGRARDLNVRGAFQHMLSDAAVSVGVVLAGIAIQFTGKSWLDPAVSLGVGAVIVLGTWSLLKESLRLAMDAVPEGTDLPAIQRYLELLPGVTAVHDLHVWAMSTTEIALTAHLIVPERVINDDGIAQICGELHSRFGIEHTTIQVERGDGAAECGQAPADVV